MENSTTASLSDVGELKKMVQELVELNRQKDLENELLKEQLALFKAQFFGKKSEKNFVLDIEDQLSFLEAFASSPVPTSIETEVVEVPAHTRTKKGRKPIPAHLPVIEVLHDLDEADKQCECGAVLSRIGQESYKQLDYIPARLQVLEHVRPKYACKTCEGVESTGSTVRIAPRPKQILPKSMASPGLLAQIVTAKFVDSLPFYRQEKQFERLGYKLKRTNMINWTIRLGQTLEELLVQLYKEVLSGPLIHMDETTIQVLKEEGRKPTSKSYMWVMKGGPPDQPSVYFYYDPSRSKSVAQSLLGGYEGVVMTDGYEGYGFIGSSEAMLHANCWAHARRKFMDVVKAKGAAAKAGNAEEALRFIRKLYAVEKEANQLENITDQKRFFMRQDKAQPVTDAFYEWLLKIEPTVSPKSLLGKAVSYTLNRWDQLVLYQSSGFIPPDNNAAENAIRPFVIGRKNWLFCDTVKGAVANARIHSLVETAKANGLNPYLYLKTLFERLPYAESQEQIRLLLPQHINSAKAEDI